MNPARKGGLTRPGDATGKEKSNPGNGNRCVDYALPRRRIDASGRTTDDTWRVPADDWARTCRSWGTDLARILPRGRERARVDNALSW